MRWEWVHLVRQQLIVLSYQPRMIDNGECGAVGGMRIGRGSRSTWRKTAPVPLCPPQIPHDLTRARTRAAAVGIRWLTAWAIPRPQSILLQLRYRLRCQSLWIGYVHREVITYTYEKRSARKILSYVETNMCICYFATIACDNNFYTHSLTHSWSWALLEKLPIVQLLENFPAFYGTRRFTTAFT
jgi:hypothetical protein